MRGSVTLGHLKGIPIRVHFSLLFLIPYLAFVMGSRFKAVATSAGVRGEELFLSPVLWGLLLTLALFVGILLHELGHSLLALRYGGHVRSITLMMLGGVSEIDGMPPTAGREAVIAVAGPVVSLALGAASFVLYRVIDGPADVEFGLFYFAQINLAVAVFNLLPAFPMDGGRVLRALLALRWSKRTATRAASFVGALFAAAFVALGITSGNFVLLLIGFFVWSGARAELESVERVEILRGLAVRDVMEPTHSVVQLSEPVEEAASLMASNHTTALPVMDGQELVGVVAAHHVENLSPEERSRMLVSAVVAREAPQLDADDSVSAALEAMAARHVEEAPVVHNGYIVGVMETSDLARMIRLKRLSEIRRSAMNAPMEDAQG